MSRQVTSRKSKLHQAKLYEALSKNWYLLRHSLVVLLEWKVLATHITQKHSILHLCMQTQEPSSLFLVAYAVGIED